MSMSSYSFSILRPRGLEVFIRSISWCNFARLGFKVACLHCLGISLPLSIRIGVGIAPTRPKSDPQSAECVDVLTKRACSLANMINYRHYPVYLKHNTLYSLQNGELYFQMVSSCLALFLFHSSICRQTSTISKEIIVFLEQNWSKRKILQIDDHKLELTTN